MSGKKCREFHWIYTTIIMLYSSFFLSIKLKGPKANPYHHFWNILRVSYTNHYMCDYDVNIYVAKKVDSLLWLNICVAHLEHCKKKEIDSFKPIEMERTVLILMYTLHSTHQIDMDWWAKINHTLYDPHCVSFGIFVIFFIIGCFHLAAFSFKSTKQKQR